MFDKIKIVTDSTTSLTKKECEERGFICLETTYLVDDVLHSAFDNEEETLPEFYKSLDKAKTISTGCINTEIFEQCFNELASQGYKVFYMGLSAALSSTFSNAQTAANTVNEKYKEKVIYLADSRAGSYGTLLLLDKVQDLLNEGKTLEEVETIISEDAFKMNVAFIAPDLKFMLKSGRITAFTLGVGTLLNLVPTIYVGDKGQLVARDKCIGKKRAIKILKNKFTDFINKNNCTRCYLSSCDMGNEIEDIKQHIASNTKIKLEDIKTGLIDKTMSCNCGPKTVAIFCL